MSTLQRMRQAVAPTLRPLMLGRTRIGLAWVLSAWLILSTRDLPWLPGAAVVVLGALMRVWSSGHIRKADALAVGGPYRWTRNPLYLGTYLMAVGTALLARSPWLLVVTSIGFFTVYDFVIEAEEERLKRLLGQPYAAFLNEVPRFFPLRGPLTRERALELSGGFQPALRFDWRLSWHNKVYEAPLAAAALVSFVYLMHRAWQLQLL